MKGHAITEMRDVLQLRQQDLAALLGRSPRHVAKLEGDYTTPNVYDEQMLTALLAASKAARPKNLRNILLNRGRLAALKAAKIC